MTIGPGTIQGTTKSAVGAGPGEKLIWTYRGPVDDRMQIYTPLTRSIDAVLASHEIEQQGNNAYSVGVYQTYTRADGSAYDRGSIYFSVYMSSGGGATGQTGIDVSAFAIGEAGRSGT